MQSTDLRKILSKEELQGILTRSDLAGFRAFAVNWGMIAASFFLMAKFPNPLTVVGGIIILAGRQLGLAILMHDCSHYSLFRTKWLNQFVGQWLCAAPVFAHLDSYRKYHLDHHRLAGTKEDPDLPNYQNYPISRQSFKRKVIRDLFGVTGLKNLAILLAMNSGLIPYSLAYKNAKETKLSAKSVLENVVTKLFPVILFQFALFFILYKLGHAWIFGVWMFTYLTAYMLVLRIRNIAEHAAVVNPSSPNPLLHTRTTYASPIARLTVAPNYVNYHLEHHLLPAVSPHHLSRFHQMLKEKGVLPAGSIFQSYKDVIKHLTRSND